jgi:RecA-family ATPase
MSVDGHSAEEEFAWLERKRELVRPPILVGAAAMLAAAELKPKMLVENAIPAGAITLIVGEPGAKKSWLAYDLALAVAQGRTWLGTPVTPHGPTRNVLVLNYDNPTPECGRRFKRLGMTPEDPIFFHSVELAPLRLPAAEAELRAIVEHLRPSLIVVDSFRQAHDQDENSSQAMAKVMGHLKGFYANGASVVVVHHAGKSSSNPLSESSAVGKARGSGEIAGSADCIINVSRVDADEGGGDVAHWGKHRSWEIPPLDESVRFELLDHGEQTVLVLKEE